MIQQFDPAQRIIDQVVAGHMSALPLNVARWAKKRMAYIEKKDGDKESRYWLRDLADHFKGLPFKFSANDADLVHEADATAKNMAMLHKAGAPLGRLLSLAKSKGIGEVKGTDDDAIMARLECPIHWRRKIRQSFNRQAETIIRNELGFVHGKNQLYISDDGRDRYLQRQKRNKAMLELMIAVNDLGQEFTLQELSDVSVSNPAIRRAELMTRIAGFESMAMDLGHAGEFITITCPSRFHAVYERSGQRNDKFDSSTPKDAQAYLQTVWGRIKSRLDRMGIKIYGFRVAEPHHDGCPHWHGLFFMDKKYVKDFRRTVARYACRADRKELGLRYVETKIEARELATERRRYALQIAETTGKKVPAQSWFVQQISVEADYWANADYKVFARVGARVDFKAINWAKGTAAGYIAKYIAKNIDGTKNNGDNIGPDFEDDKLRDLQETAVRVIAWASTWGIRQFQQVGGAPVGVWRELRRIDADTVDAGQDIERAARAADAGDWGKYVSIMGGIGAARKDLLLMPHKDPVETLNRYNEPCQPVLRGIKSRLTGEIQVTREHQWVLTLKGREANTRTGVNNSTKNPFLKPEFKNYLDNNDLNLKQNFDCVETFHDEAPELRESDFSYAGGCGTFTMDELQLMKEAKTNSARTKKMIQVRDKMKTVYRPKGLYAGIQSLNGTLSEIDVSVVTVGYSDVEKRVPIKAAVYKRKNRQNGLQPLAPYSPGEFANVKPKAPWFDYSKPESVDSILARAKALIEAFDNFDEEIYF